MQLSNITLFGISHKTASLELREKVALSETVCLQGMGHLVAAGIISEIVIYSTCNRLEFLYVAQNQAKAKALVCHFLKARTGIADSDIEAGFYTKTGLNAVKHLFSVAASLDSMVVGEPQILGQLKAAYKLAQEARSTGVVLNRLLHKTFFTAKKIRTETAVGSHSVSISHAAVDLAKNTLSDLSRCGVLLIGAGEMGALAAQKVARYQPQTFLIANRTYAKAQNLAASLQGAAVAWDELAPALEKVDLVISSTVSNNYILWYNDLVNRTRPLVIIDISLPRNVDPAINTLAACTVYDLDSIQATVAQNMGLRENEAQCARALIEAEALAFANWLHGLALKPTMLALRAKLHETVVQELERNDIATDAAKAARSVVNRFLHDPTQRLKTLEQGDKQDLYLDLIRKLFDLDA